MKNRLVWLLAATLALTPLVPTGALAAETDFVVTQSGLEKLAAEKATLLTEKYGTTSVQYALIENGNIKVSGQTGLNDKEGEIPLSQDTLYGIGSTSKMFTTAAVMKLVDEGKIDLDTPLVHYITDFKMKDKRYKQITPRMLLNHSSGLQGTTLRNAFLFNDADTNAHDTLLKQLSTQHLKADPGAFSVYCNDGFSLAEILVERVSGMKFTAFIHKYITEPLQMNHTKTSQDGLEPSEMAGLYYPNFQEQLPNETVNAIGAGGIYSTVEDLARFSQIFTGQHKGIISDKAVQAMQQEEYKRGLWPEEADNSFDFGLGWDSVKLFPFNDYGIKALSKGGDTILYHASLIVLPEQNMAAAVLTSGGSSSLNQMLASELLLEALKEKGAIKEIKPEKSFGKPVKAEMPEDMLKNAGYYVATGQQVKISIKDGELTSTIPLNPNYPDQKYIYTADGSFVNELGNTKINFVTEKNGRTYIWVREYTSIPGLGQSALSYYMVEKANNETLPLKTEEAWAKRDGKTYVPVNEKFNSVIYMLNPVIQVIRDNELKNYLGDKKITGPDTAASEHQMPLLGSRDTAEYHFYKKDGIEYFKSAGTLYASEDIVKPLNNGAHSEVTVQADGNAKWFSIPDAAAGKMMTVDMPERGAFVVYDGAGNCVNYTMISGDPKAVLPEKGRIVFAGDAGSVFKITLEKK